MHVSLDSLLDLKRLALPEVPKVEAIEWQPISDHVGNDAYFITVIIPDDTPAEHRERKLTRAIEGIVRQALIDAGIQEFAYTRTLSRADLREADEDAAAEVAEDGLQQEQNH